MAHKSPETTWISVPAAASLLGVGLPAVDTLIREGRLTVRAVPGSYRRVLRSEIESLAEASTIPARAS